MNEENQREGRNEQQAEVDNGITDINSEQIDMVLRNINNWKAIGPDLSGRSVEDFGKNWRVFSEGSIEQYQ